MIFRTHFASRAGTENPNLRLSTWTSPSHKVKKNKKLRKNPHPFITFSTLPPPLKNKHQSCSRKPGSRRRHRRLMFLFIPNLKSGNFLPPKQTNQTYVEYVGMDFVHMGLELLLVVEDTITLGAGDASHLLIGMHPLEVPAHRFLQKKEISYTVTVRLSPWMLTSLRTTWSQSRHFWTLSSFGCSESMWVSIFSVVQKVSSQYLSVKTI